MLNGNWVAHIDIMAQCVTPLNSKDADSTYGWLLEGTEQEVRRIHGITGLSPKLLHTYAQITRLTARINEVSDFHYQLFLKNLSKPNTVT